MQRIRLVFVSLILVLSCCVATAAPSKPNIIILLVDDMGFSDIGCYGSEIPTPNLDRLAAEGLRFTQFYNTGRCCPTRAALLTGLYSHEAGVGHMTEDKGQPGYRGDLNEHCVTIADVLRGAGYRTMMTGKWHVTRFVHPASEAEKHNWPLQRGFDNYFGIIQGGANYFHPKPLTMGNQILDELPKIEFHSAAAGALPHPAERDGSDGFYTTDAFVDQAITFIDAGEKQKPFFLYLAFNAPHFPLMAPQDEIAKFRGKYKIGWDKLREQRNARQKELGVVDAAWALSPRPPRVKAWESVTAEEQDRFDQIMSIYAADVAHIDTAVGRLVAALQQRGMLDNTLLMFLSDNGGNAESGPRGRMEGQLPGSENSTVYCGQSWATLENTPFRRYKHFNHEGGIATPFIVHWPKGLQSRAGVPPAPQFRTQPAHLVDLMATCVDVSGAKYPKEFQGRTILPMEGRSLLPAFADKPIKRDALYWEHEGNAAIRVDDWKLVRLGRTGAWELYNMKTDRTELHDLSAEQPDRAKALATKWDAWATRTHVMPYPAQN
ncbi:MAG: arylsulfatase [Verrucomicrobia bacterium]|nr:MAG: arylsulfatase [Verrucomicrobiota bacterium]